MDQSTISPQPSDRSESRPPTVQERLLDLAQDVSSYLRHHRQSSVRVAAALLLASSLAACAPAEQSDLASVPVLAKEVRDGLPTAPGRYSIDPQTLGRDSQGVYHFSWLAPGGGAASPASVSLLRLAESDRNELEIPSSGDPVLHLRSDTPVPLVASAAELAQPSPTPTPGGSSSTTRSSSYHSPGVMWFPFPVGGTSSTPVYRDPPTTVGSDSVARGSTASTAPPAPDKRTSGLPYAVSGQKGGTGSGTAATNKSVGGGSSFFGGQSGGTGGGSAATNKSGSSGSSADVGGARSGGFSGGLGGIFGGSSS